MSADLFAAFADHSAATSTEAPVKREVRASASIDLEESRPQRQGFLPEERKVPALASPLWNKDAHGSNVLFDAEDPQQEDEFGEFEDVTSVAVAPQGYPNTAVCASSNSSHTVQGHRSSGPLVHLDLLSLADEQGETESTDPISSHPSEWPRIQPGAKLVATGEEDWGEYENVQAPAESSPLPGTVPQDAIKTSQGDQKSLTCDSAQSWEFDSSEPAHHAIQRENDESADDWDAFEDGTPGAASGVTRSISPSTKGFAEQQSTHAQTARQQPARSSNAERPTNIPPPVMLLQMLCSTFDSIHATHLTGLELKEELASRVLMAYRVANRIIAGRTHRWKRDTILAQNMRIGQAGKSGGMKLATVNKGESVREQREVADMMSLWSRYTHDFQSVLAQAHKSANRLKMNAAPTIHVIPGQDRSKQCALCGLKRSERVTDVDVGTQDLFDEFWIEHWGHRDCSELWYMYKDLLNQR